MKATITTANQWFLKNLFWLVPLNFALLLFGISMGIYQRTKIKENTAKGIENQSKMLHNDSVAEEQRKSMTDSISAKWNESFKNLKRGK